MPIEVPIWMQDEDYAARLDRGLIEAFGVEGVITGMKVTERSTGANFSVDVAAGSCVVQGDDQASQGSYFVRSTATVNVSVGAPNPSNPRIDAVVMQVRDQQAGGEVGDLAEIRVIAGGAAPTPAAPTLPLTAMLLAYINVPVGLAAVTDAQIVDQRTLARPTVVVSETEPTDPIAGLVWLEPS